MNSGAFRNDAYNTGIIFKIKRYGLIATGNFGPAALGASTRLDMAFSIGICLMNSPGPVFVNLPDILYAANGRQITGERHFAFRCAFQFG